MQDAATLVRAIQKLHHETVDRWHRQPPSVEEHGLLGVVCQQHLFNFLLWHEEDIARNPHVTDARIAEVKRAIDRYNQQRNDWIERVDLALLEQLSALAIQASPHAPLNTETPGSAIDRLSILALRIYHLQEQLARTDVGSDHLANVEKKIVICRQQQSDLATSLTALLDDIFAGRKRMQLYQQLKMYNDRTLNPQIYGTRGS